MTTSKKPSAADRTVDIFSGRTRADEAAKIEVEPEEASHAKSSENIEQAAERWRNTAIFTAEHLSKHYNESLPEAEKFRITEKGNLMFLEKFSLDKKCGAYAWSGVMFHRDSLYELTSVFVKASKERKNDDSD